VRIIRSGFTLCVCFSSRLSLKVVLLWPNVTYFCFLIYYNVVCIVLSSQLIDCAALSCKINRRQIVNRSADGRSFNDGVGGLMSIKCAC